MTRAAGIAGCRGPLVFIALGALILLFGLRPRARGTQPCRSTIDAELTGVQVAATGHALSGLGSL